MLIYRILTLIVIFFLPLISIYRLIKKKDTLNSIKQKIGYYNKQPKKNLIWFHGASVGEVLSIMPLVKELEKDKKISQILITSSTISSAKVLNNIKFKKTVHQFFPLDANFITIKFLKYWKPKVCIFVESEIWPNMIKNIKENKLPLILLNARITNKSYKRWKKLDFFSKRLFSLFDVSYPQNQETARYLKKLGSKKLEYIGNLKLCDLKQKQTILNSRQTKYFKSKKIPLIGYSTHRSEEKFCAEIFQNLRKSKNETLILIPRHVERASLIEKDLMNKNLFVHRHSSDHKIDSKTNVYLVDTYGEAKKFLGLSKVIFIGGSLVPHGGQNPLDAVRSNAIVIHGPNIGNFKEIYKFLNNEKISFKFHSMKQALNLIKNKNSINRNTKAKLTKISSKILAQTKHELLKYV